MPYIKQSDRYELWNYDERKVSNPGELNYVITGVIHEYLTDNGESYQSYNDILGALEGAKLELYRRRVAPYEDKKITENGDV